MQVVKHGYFIQELSFSFKAQKFVYVLTAGSVVVVAFQIIFHVKIHANDVFLFFKNYF
jgi:hypothetical protein